MDEKGRRLMREGPGGGLEKRRQRVGEEGGGCRMREDGPEIEKK